MRKAYILALCLPFLLVSCNYFGKPNKEVEVLILQKQNLEQRIKNDSLNYAREMASLRMEYEQKLAAFEAANNRSARGFFVVVGSFKDPKLAETFAAKVQSLGHEGKIIDGPNVFNCVTFGTFPNLNESLPALANARTIAEDAWIMIR